MDIESREMATKPVQRLCSEIQLFDLCDLESCNYRSGRFCCNSELVSRFEQIAEDDMSCPAGQYLTNELDELNEFEDDDEVVYHDEIEDDCEDEDRWEE